MKTFFSRVCACCILESFRIQRGSNGWRWRVSEICEIIKENQVVRVGTILVPRKPLSGIKLDEWGKKTVALIRLSRMPFGRALNEIDSLKLILDIRNSLFQIQRNNRIFFTFFFEI